MKLDPSNPECPRPRQSYGPGCPLRGSLPAPVPHSSSDGIHNCWAGNPLRKSARSRSSPPSAPLDPAPSVSPMAAASHLLSVCTAASPEKDDTGLHATPLRSPTKTLPALVVRWPRSSRIRSPPRRHWHVLDSMLPTGRHSYRSGRTAHGTAVSYSAWHTSIVCAGVVVLFHQGYWPLLACPRTYLPPRRDQSKAPSLQRVVMHAFPGTYGPLGLPPGSVRLQPSGLIRPVFARRFYCLGCQVGSLLFRSVLFQRATACDPGEVQHPFRPRMLSVAFAVK